MLTALNDNYEAIQELRDTGYGAADFEVKKAMVEFSIPASVVAAKPLRQKGIDLITFSQANASLLEHLILFE